MDLLQKAFGAGFNFLLDEVFSGDTEDAPRFNVQRAGRTGGIRTYDARFSTIPDVLPSTILLTVTLSFTNPS